MAVWRGVILVSLLLSGTYFAYVGSLAAPRPRGTYAKLEAAFELTGVTGNPFDAAENDVRVTFRLPSGATVEAPAFFDGGKTWRARYTPAAPGQYALTRVTRNGAEARPEGLERRSFQVTGRPGPGFVRRDPGDAARFVFDNGEGYYPLGHNTAWKDPRDPDIPELFAKMARVGENWARVWMNHWDGKNLDWPADRAAGLGMLNLEAARRWDRIVEAAEKHGIYFQMVLQHHGQYSTRTDPNWNDNPWNTKNGGFLATPEEFFTDARARALTRAKYRYILARWGYSPAIMAWELFNEVQWTDAIRNGRGESVTAWHREMAAFLREHDPNRHLVTTSSDTNIVGLFDAMDFVQPHAYRSDILAAISALKPSEWRRPVFFGEVGPSGRPGDGMASFLHTALWGSLMSENSGAAQYWYWDRVEREGLYELYRPAAGFLKAARRASFSQMRSLRPEVKTAGVGSLSFGPGGDWGSAARTEFVVAPSGNVEEIGGMPRYLQGNAHRELFPSATFQVEYAHPGEFSVAVTQVARAGGHLVLQVDGQTAAERDFPAGERDQRTDTVLTARVPPGRHTIRVENTGADWLVVDRFTLAPYGPSLRALAAGNREHAEFWLTRAASTEQPEQGTVRLAGLAPGRYRVTWWDTKVGKEVTAQTVTVPRDGVLMMTPPPIATDIAGWATRS